MRCLIILRSGRDENPIIATNRDGEQVAQSLNDIFQTGELGKKLAGLVI